MKRIKDMDSFNRAKSFAIRKHKGQKRKNGSAYVHHPIRVADIVLRFKDREDIAALAIAALLHDTLEDTDTGISELREEFGEVVTLLVVELTTDNFASDIIGKTEYLSNKLSSDRAISGWALAIKLADMLDNVSDLKTSDPKFAKRYKLHTLAILGVLESERVLSKTHKKLIKAIREKLREMK